MTKLEKGNKKNLSLSSKLQFTNNCLESLNGTINSLMNKGRVSVERFEEIMGAILSYYSSSQFSKERKTLMENKDTKVSTLMIFLANSPNSTNILQSIIWKNIKVLKSSNLIIFISFLGRLYDSYMQEFDENVYMRGEKSGDDSDESSDNLPLNIGYSIWGDNEEKDI